VFRRVAAEPVVAIGRGAAEAFEGFVAGYPALRAYLVGKGGRIAGGHYLGHSTRYGGTAVAKSLFAWEIGLALAAELAAFRDLNACN
jgi:hypothetical protein